MSEANILEIAPLAHSESTARDELYGQDHTMHGQAIGTPSHNLGEEPSRRTKIAKTKEKPTHYKVVCISLYTQDIENLEATVAELKRRGHTKANKSQLIRQALRLLDIDKLPPPQQ